MAEFPFPPAGNQLYEKLPEPPDAVTLILPSLPPLQERLVLVALRLIAAGELTMVVAVRVQPFASVAVTVYVPAARPVAVAPERLPGDHE